MFVKAANGAIVQFPYSVGALRRDNPNTSFPKDIPKAVLAEHGVFEVKMPAPPAHDPETQFVEYSPVPSLVDGSWVHAPTVRQLSAEQLAERRTNRAADARLQRNALLSETDWMALSDVTMTPEMRSYRQALRDLTTQPGFPDSISWPTKPE
jgi:hypothetical protein